MSVTEHPSPNRGTIRSRRWRLAVLPVLMALPMGLAACGGSSDAATSTTTAGNAQGSAGNAQGSAGNGRAGGGIDTAAMDTYASCLKDNGVTLPDRPRGGPPSGGGSGAPSNGSSSNGSSSNGSSSNRSSSNRSAPTPPAGGYGAPASAGQAPQGGGLPGLDTSDPTVAKAVQACASLQPRMPAAP